VHAIGAYRLVRELGRGGMGIVHEALAPDGRTVALKLLLSADPEDLARFERETRLLLRG
jgi:eukaryotic-like serine/threonine-protein kinase